jgi:hypothetical protein
MKQLLIMLFAAVPFLAFCAVPTDPPAEDDTLAVTATPTIFKGTIGSIKDYSPLSDVRLTLTPFEGGAATTVQTDSLGKFVLASIPGGIYKVRFEKEGYEAGVYQSLYIQPGTTKNFGFLMFED